MKARVLHIVPLSTQAITILQELPPLTGSGRYVFPSLRTSDRPMSENTVNAALRRLGYGGDQMTGHGFRSMASTLLHEQVWNRDAIERQLLVREVLRPSVRVAVTAQSFSKVFGELELNALVNELAAQVKVSNDGDLRRSEAMLVAQAHSLEAIFHELARRAVLNMGEYINATEIYLRLALKAQSQCRATNETLALMKNPQPVTLGRQANVAHGPQQDNNVPQPAQDRASRARESGNPQNKLLEQQNGEGVGPRAAQATIGAYPAVETMGEVHGAEDGCR